MIAAMLLALQRRFGLVFDPRYKDFPFAPLTAAIVPLLTLSLEDRTARAREARPNSRRAGAAALS